MICGKDSLAAVGAHLSVAAVVQEDYIAAANLLLDFSLDHFCWRGVPVVAGDIPQDRLETQPAGDIEDCGTATSEGWTEEVGVLADCVLERCSAVAELLAHLHCTLERQQRMRECVIAYYVSALNKFTDDIGALSDEASDQEKRCADVVTSQDLQEAERVRVVGSVVVGESQLPGAARESHKGAAVPLAGRAHGLVASGDSCSRRGSGEHGSEHSRIVAIEPWRDCAELDGESATAP